jgi:hypothetical protein
MATLERPAKAQLDEEIMTSLGSESSPITLEQILAKLRSTSSSSRSVYMHELARSIWRLADEGKVIVESGLIRKRHSTQVHMNVQLVWATPNAEEMITCLGNAQCRGDDHAYGTCISSQEPREHGDST